MNLDLIVVTEKQVTPCGSSASHKPTSDQNRRF
jgi:hypothetical protein